MVTRSKARQIAEAPRDTPEMAQLKAEFFLVKQCNRRLKNKVFFLEKNIVNLERDTDRRFDAVVRALMVHDGDIDESKMNVSLMLHRLGWK
jgi:hypothetical protein